VKNLVDQRVGVDQYDKVTCSGDWAMGGEEVSARGISHVAERTFLSSYCIRFFLWNHGIEILESE
jgi:hypothetical protein